MGRFSTALASFLWLSPALVAGGEATDVSDVRQALAVAIDDEYKARASYRAVIEKFGSVRPFSRIVESEERHIAALEQQFRRLGVAIPEDPWPQRTRAPATVEEACSAAVELEIANEALYAELLPAAEGDPEVHKVFERLRAASLERHLPAFRRCVERGGRPGSPPGGGRGGPPDGAGPGNPWTGDGATADDPP